MPVRLTSSRRMFLRGAAGATLAIPFLPSILRRSVARADSTATRVFMALQCEHGGMSRGEFFPDDAIATSTTSLGGLPWQARHGLLQRSESGGRAEVSPVLSAGAGSLTPRLVESMNALCGLDYSIYAGHNITYALGAYATGGGDYESKDSWGPSIDQLIAYSRTFYPQAPEGGPVVPLPLLQTGESVGHLQPGNPSSPLGIRGATNDDRLWATLFQPGGPTNGITDPELEPARRVAAMNDAYAAYARLQSRASSAGSRLSSEDALRLERHMDAVSQMRNRIEAASACDVMDPGGGIPAEDRGRVRGELARAAVECGISRVFNFNVLNWDLVPTDIIDRWGGSHGFAHAAANEDPVNEARDWWHTLYQKIFEFEVLPMVQALDFEDADGQNVLDNSLLLWTSEAGMQTHQSHSIPVVTFGSLGGCFSTGNFVDYRSPRDFGDVGRRAEWLRPDWRLGVLYDQFLGTVLQGFGVPLAEYDHYRARPAGERGSFERAPEGAPRVGGYGAYSVAQVQRSAAFYHEEDVHRFAEEPLPVLWRG